MGINQIKVGEVVSKIYTSDLSTEFIQSSYDAIEEAKIYDWRFTRSKIVTSCITSFSAIEAYINRVFYDSYSTSSKTKLNILSHIPEAIKQHIKTSWGKLSIKDKCIILIPLISIKTLQINQKPFNLFIEFVKFRNRLVHAKSWETEENVFVTHVNLNEQMKGSWGGKILSKKSLQPNENYPLTKFSNDLTQLNINDAEKALEIAILMILEIRSMIPGSYTEPGVNFRIPKNNIDGTSLNNVLNFIPRHYDK
jgi:hypothetical protein